MDDVQSDSHATTALAALVQSIAHLELEEGFHRDPIAGEIEILTENRFIAARDGMDRFLEPINVTRVEARRLLADLFDAAEPHAEQLGCSDEPKAVRDLAAQNGAARQRQAHANDGSLSAIVADLAERFLTISAAAPMRHVRCDAHRAREGVRQPSAVICPSPPRSSYRSDRLPHRPK